MSAASLGSGPLSDVEEGSSGRQVSSRIRGTWRGLGSGSSRNRSTASILSSYRLHLPLRSAWSRSHQAACQSSSRTDPVFVQAVSIAVRAWARARSSCAHSMTSSSISRAPAASRHGMPWNAVFGSGRPSRIALPIPTRDGRGGTPDAVVSVSPSYVRAPRKRCKSLVEPVCGTVLPLQRSPLRGLASLLGRHGSCPPKLADLLTTRPASMRS